MRHSLLIAGVVVLAMISAGCGERKQYGAPIDSRTSVVALKQIAENPDAYKDKEVVLQGIYGFYCCPADFSYKEGLDVVSVAPQGFSAPKSKVGTPMTLYGVVRTGPLPEEEGEASEKAEGTQKFYIEAKGMVLR